MALNSRGALTAAGPVAVFVIRVGDSEFYEKSSVHCPHAEERCWSVLVVFRPNDDESITQVLQ